ncbi:hypothetical protein CFBP6762_03280 [Xanthomonas arboricola pv. fragariae]|nr:hypothetical protein CFBP6762_03280 [Xanthomonas arboricola pv. fragariae]
MGKLDAQWVFRWEAFNAFPTRPKWEVNKSHLLNQCPTGSG